MERSLARWRFTTGGQTIPARARDQAAESVCHPAARRRRAARRALWLARVLLRPRRPGAARCGPPADVPRARLHGPGLAARRVSVSEFGGERALGYLAGRSGPHRLRRDRQRRAPVRACTCTGRSSRPAWSRRCCSWPTCVACMRLGQHYVDSTSNSFLYPMINVSDNTAATRTWSIVGQSAVYAVARAAGMTDFSVVRLLGQRADQRRRPGPLLLRDGLADPAASSSATPGVCCPRSPPTRAGGSRPMARPLGYNVFFKGGWRTTGLGQLVHQVGAARGARSHLRHRGDDRRRSIDELRDRHHRGRHSRAHRLS